MIKFAFSEVIFLLITQWIRIVYEKFAIIVHLRGKIHSKFIYILLEILLFYMGKYKNNNLVFRVWRWQNRQY